MTSYESVFPKTQVCFLCFLSLSSQEGVGHMLPLSHAGVWGCVGVDRRHAQSPALHSGGTKPHETRTHIEGSIHPGHAN